MTGAEPDLTPLSPARWWAPPLPRAPLERVLQRLADRIVRRHPQLLDRINVGEGARLRLRPTDLPWQAIVHLSETRFTVRLLERDAETDACTACVEGTLARLIGCGSGRSDGDALFFSRDLQVSGDTTVLVAIRNALDDAEIDFSAELAALAGPLSGAARRLLRLGEHGYREAAASIERLRAGLTAPLRARVDAQEQRIAELRAEIHRLARRNRGKTAAAQSPGSAG